MLRRSLELDGHSIAVGNSGRSGIDLLNSGRFDLVISDIIMPDMDGLDVLRYIRQSGIDIRTIIISGGSPRQDKEYLLKTVRLMQVDAALTKPLDLNELTTLIQQLVPDKQPSDTQPITD